MPIHLIWGDDTGARELAIENFIQKIIDPEWRSFNLSRIDGSDSEQENRILEEVRTPPFGNGSRAVLVNKSPFCNGCSQELANKFISIISLIPQETYLILNNLLKPDGRLKTTKKLQDLIKSKDAFEKSFILPPVWDEAGQKKVIERTAESLGLQLEESAIFVLLGAIGNDTSRLISELEKLSLLQQSKEGNKNNSNNELLIKVETVKDLIGGLATNSLQVGDCLLQEDVGGALFRIDSLLNSGEPPLRILASLTTQIRGWLWVALLESKGHKDVTTIAKAAGIANPKRIYVIRKQIQGKPFTLFLNLLTRLLEIEADLKKGVMPSNAFKDNLLTQ
tara:strand:- start:15073 stop:16080 length:1008 start_codon:yes stop_codon:yes gene_type:complete